MTKPRPEADDDDEETFTQSYLMEEGPDGIGRVVSMTDTFSDGSTHHVAYEEVNSRSRMLWPAMHYALGVAALASAVMISFVRDARAQVPDSSAHASTIVRGTVYDSIGRAPLSGAVVQIVSINQRTLTRGATADSVGRFTIPDVALGEYIIGFLHPMPDSLGLEMPIRRITVANAPSVRADLSIPGPRTLGAAVCPARSPTDSAGVVMGIVRDAKSLLPVASASVLSQWVEMTLSSRGLETAARHMVVESHSNGWFVLCGAPPGGTIGILAARGADSTGMIELEIPASGFLRRDLYVGSATVQTIRDSMPASDSVPPISRQLRTGDMVLRGAVLTSAGARPLAGAHVAIDEGPEVTADAGGEWMIPDAPAGTRIVTVRAVGYYPERRVVDIATNAAPMRSSLSTLKAVLDTVKVNATLLYDRDRNGFQQRRRMGIGHFLTREEIARRHAIETTDLFRTMLGIRVVQAGAFDSVLLMRGGGFSPWCRPATFVDGMRIELTGGDLNSWVQPDHITGVEVYAAGQAPVQYQTLTGCGSVLTWTR